MATETEEKVIKSQNVLSGTLKSKTVKDTHLNDLESVHWKCSTGSLLLDVATGAITPGLVRLAGPPNEGKTPQALEIIRNFLATVERSKAVWVIAEGRGLSSENVARCGLKFVYDPEEWDYGTVFVLESNIFETFAKVVSDLITNNDEKNAYAFVVDSMDGLVLKADADKDIDGENKVAGVPAISKKLMQKISVRFFKMGHLMVLLSQQTQDINLDKYAAKAKKLGSFSGGNALSHAADLVLEYKGSYAGDYILDKPDAKMNDSGVNVLGKNARVIIRKSTLEKSRLSEISYPIKFGRKPSGIWTEREVGDLLFTWGACQRKGAWISFSDEFRKEVENVGVQDFPEKIQGLENFYNTFEKYPQVVNYFYDKFKKIYS